MSELALLVAGFMDTVGNGSTEIYNEFSLQHELGIFLRSELQGYKIQFERNIRDFATSGSGFTKREIDIVVFAEDGRERKYAIELKFPRRGQYPEQMFSFCKDIAFAEELNAAGFSRTALLIVVDDRLFYSGASDGIYRFFRAGHPISGRIDRPTGSKDEHVVIKGSYSVAWSSAGPEMRYALIEVGDGSPDSSLQSNIGCRPH